MDPTSRASIDAAEASGYLRALRAQAKSMCVPFWWHGPKDDGEYVIHRNGTLCFVDTGNGQFGFTADHVLAQWLLDRELDPRITCQFGSGTVDPGSRVIARDADLDLATLRASDVMVVSSGASFHAPRAWPSPSLAAGEVLFCGGYPGKIREPHETTADFPFQWFLGRVNAASAHNIALEIDFENFHVPLGDPTAMNRVLGGMSGGPVFRYVPGPIEHLEIVGIIYQHQESYGLLLARPVQVIGSDGTLRHVDSAD